MAGETFRIEIPIDAIDRTGPGFDAASKRVSRWETQMNRSEKQLQRMNRTRWQVALQAIDRASPVLTKINGALARATGKTWSIALRIAGAPGRMLSSLTSIPAILTGIATGAAVKGGIMWPLELAGNLEQSRIAFETMLGSAAAADRFLGDLQVFAAKTPFDFAGLQDNAKRMLAFGFAADQVLPTLTAVGNAASGLGAGTDGVNRITLALGQMRAKGKVSAEEMMQLTDVGVAGWDILAGAMGVSTAEAMKLAERGLIPAEKAIQALVDGMNRRFPNMMERQSRSLLGLSNTIKEVFQLRLVTAWGEGIRTAVQPRIQALVDWFDRNDAVVEQWRQTLQGAGKAMADWVISKAERLQQILSDLSQSEVWQQADAFGRLRLLWDKVVVEPFTEWWASGGKDQVDAIAKEIGAAMAVGMGGAINHALPGILREAGKVAPGGQKATPLSWLSALALTGVTLWAGGKGIGLVRGGVNLYRSLRGLRGAGAAAKGAAAAASTAAEVANAAKVAETLSILGPNSEVISTVARSAAETSRVTGAAAKTAGLSRFMGAIKGSGKMLGRLAIPLGIAGDALSIATAASGEERAKAVGGSLGGWAGFLAGAKLGAMGGGATGAAFAGVGAVPGAAIGGLLGGLAGMFGGDWLGRQAGAAVHDAISRETSSASRQPLNLTIEYRPDIRIYATAANAQDVLRVIRENGETLADDLARSFAAGFETVMANM